MIKDILKMLKVNHYIKNTIVFVPILLSKNFYNLDSFLYAFVIFISFCAVSSAVYIFNDIVDIEKDRLHPIKKNRAIASGRISKVTAVIILLILLCMSIFISYYINLLCLLMVFAYFVLNIFYSFVLKNIALIDAASIALGFILRIVAGCFAIKVIPSPLVILLTLFLSMFFTYSKRKLEFQLVENNESCRKSLQGFDIDLLKQFVLMNAVLSVSFYITYILDAKTIERAQSEFLYITVLPFVLIVFRLLYLVNVKQAPDDPMFFIEKDSVLKWLFVIYIIIFLLVLNL